MKPEDFFIIFLIILGSNMFTALTTNRVLLLKVNAAVIEACQTVDGAQ